MESPISSTVSRSIPQVDNAGAETPVLGPTVGIGARELVGTPSKLK
jgi:hypothetical protein